MPECIEMRQASHDGAVNRSGLYWWRDLVFSVSRGWGGDGDARRFGADCAC